MENPASEFVVMTDRDISRPRDPPSPPRDCEVDGRNKGEEEERWIEADWSMASSTGGGKGSEGNDDALDDVPEMGDLFADPDPYDIFLRTYRVRCGNIGEKTPATATGGGQEEEFDDLTVSLRGVKAENGQTIRSTGLTLWRASDLLCRYLCSHPSAVRGQSVAELGAGLGLCGIVAASLGARNVMMTDGDTDTLKGMRENVSSNFDRGQRRRDGDGGGGGRFIRQW